MHALKKQKFSGTYLKKFGYIEHDVKLTDLSIIKNIITHGNHFGNVLYIIRNAVIPLYVKQLLDGFNKQISLQGSTRENDGYVKNQQIGATQFSKSGLDYIESVNNNFQVALNLYDYACEETIESCFMTKKLEQFFISENAHFGPARYKNSWGSFATFRRWLDNGKMSLMPHEDKAQLRFALKDNFEIHYAKNVIAYNVCLECSGLGGELKVWNLEPDDAFRSKLGIIDTGYPYPLEYLEEIDQINVKINPGDIYFLNANNLHGVTSMIDGQRLTAGRFIAAISDNKIIFWT